MQIHLVPETAMLIFQVMDMLEKSSSHHVKTNLEKYEGERRYFRAMTLVIYG